MTKAFRALRLLKTAPDTIRLTAQTALRLNWASSRSQFRSCRSSSSSSTLKDESLRDFESDLLVPPPQSSNSRSFRNQSREVEYDRDFYTPEEEIQPEKGELGPVPIKLPGRRKLKIYPDGLMMVERFANHIISYTRLRDNCRCSKCIDISTRQKLHSSGSIFSQSTSSSSTTSSSSSSSSIIIDPSASSSTSSSTTNPEPIGALKVFEGFDNSGNRGVHLHFTDGHQSFFSGYEIIDIINPEASSSILSIKTKGDRINIPNLEYLHPRRFWNKTTLESSDDLTLDYNDLKEGIKTQKEGSGSEFNESLFRLLKQVHIYGIVIVKNVPCEFTDDERCELRKFTNMIGQIRNTFYGEVWDVKSVENSKNVAYTSQDLGLHMDLLYFTNPPRFQALHCLKNQTSGGESYFVDSFYAARHLQDNQPYIHKLLRRNKVEFMYNNDDHYLSEKHQTIPTANLQSLRSAVYWSPPFQAPMRRIGGFPTSVFNPPKDVSGSLSKSSSSTSPPSEFLDLSLNPAFNNTSQGGSKDINSSHMSRQTINSFFREENNFYKALSKFEQTLNRPECKYEFLMKAGDLVFFDNLRVLHARRSFGGGERWLKGCYLDGDAVWDKLRMLSIKEADRRQ